MNRRIETALRKYNFRKRYPRRKRTSCLLRAITIAHLKKVCYHIRNFFQFELFFCVLCLKSPLKNNGEKKRRITAAKEKKYITIKSIWSLKTQNVMLMHTSAKRISFYKLSEIPIKAYGHWKKKTRYASFKTKYTKTLRIFLHSKLLSICYSSFLCYAASQPLFFFMWVLTRKKINVESKS